MDARTFNVYIHNKDMILTSISCLYIYIYIYAIKSTLNSRSSRKSLFLKEKICNGYDPKIQNFF